MALPKIETPKYSLTVPSTGKTIQYRPYLVKEEKVLMIAMQSQQPSQMVMAIKDIISTCTFGSVNIEEMTMYDMEYIFIALRAKSVGEVSEIGIKCEKCNFKNDVAVNLNEIEVKIPKNIKYEIQLTDDIGIKLRFPNVDSIFISQQDQSRSDVDKTFDIIIDCIEFIFQGDEIFKASEQTREELQEFVESLSTEQFNKIRDFIEQMPTTQLDASFLCTKCGHPNSLIVKGMNNFFK